MTRRSFCLTDQPVMLVLPDWWKEQTLQGQGSKAVAKSKVATTRKTAAPKSSQRVNGTASPPSAAMQPVAVSEDEIRLRAYLKWQAAGRPAGDGVNFWLEAKRELLPEK